ncbi:MAG: bifunctional demethylmenaquinone methyltransferase/2-methoxy-6-polyprenyl-1,4-benzoquinol methylase UbiE [Melioribacteraceae bacterium]|nr:bifunctional demethylmenaquinone methyltransferase/2-methoxy-6-polyprenyl-1,4-benzoquinol methylase UbiE [Melioribacteraceae bacterium]MCF8356179.1 bifunctional demethylmenaquinone methyltransferase/2-methoxy-6-polyprenyl-1,4-benzoquinol methylase UbiE [Melioribacteraceae bacterium]MCF8394750.1 bifunctional demethylmenaquinone methyltransferase/2-methoxy-6-polyprenyl-1,4-benzoquinol methylase UbiE [Melioribacteraceae bacterium]MCF8417950.1 bifunctional demethylmenaquinone methyltransferase/2-
MKEKRKQVNRIFDSISHRYDLLNHLLSAGIDFYWRKKALKLTGMNRQTVLLDVACGTGDFAIAARQFNVEKIIGADLSINMLKYFNQKRDWSKGKIVQSVAEELPFKSGVFTNITVAFGVRNFYDIKEGFESFHRVLCENGKVTILEFRLPQNKLVKELYLFYFNKVLPKVGKFISKDKEAYTYLPESVNEFDSKIDIPKLLKEAGFTNVQRKSMTFGIVQLVIGQK